ncbi:hypothetical protein BH10PSE19_BH10PSE19_14090 [soil metagenome]
MNRYFPLATSPTSSNKKADLSAHGSIDNKLSEKKKSKTLAVLAKPTPEVSSSSWGLLASKLAAKPKAEKKKDSSVFLSNITTAPSSTHWPSLPKGLSTKQTTAASSSLPSVSFSSVVASRSENDKKIKVAEDFSSSSSLPEPSDFDWPLPKDAAAITAAEASLREPSKSKFKQAKKPPHSNEPPVEPSTAAEQFSLGHQCELKGDLSAAKHWYHLAADQKHPHPVAMFSLGCLIYNGGEGSEEDEEKALAFIKKAVGYLKAAADKNDPYIQASLGRCYAEGWEVVKDDFQAVEWYRKAAVQGNTTALVNLGWCYAHGMGVSQNSVQALKWYRKAASQNSALGQYLVGYCYENGIGVRADWDQAVEWYKRAADQGYAAALDKLRRGVGSSSGSGVQRTLHEEKKRVSFATETSCASTLPIPASPSPLAGVLADRKSETALPQVSSIKAKKKKKSPAKSIAISADDLSHPLLIPEKNDNPTILSSSSSSSSSGSQLVWHQKASTQPMLDVVLRLGYQYSKGKNFIEAVQCYEIAAAGGYAPAQNNLGACYQQGIGVPQDYIKAAELYRLAAVQGHPVAQYNLGCLHENGTGVKADKTEAVKWYRLSAAQGQAAAQTNLGCCYEEGVGGVAQDFLQAAEWYRQAVVQGDPVAQYKLGCLYEKGTGVEENKTEAIKCYQLAAAQGQEDAVVSLDNLLSNNPMAAVADKEEKSLPETQTMVLASSSSSSSSSSIEAPKLTTAAEQKENDAQFAELHKLAVQGDKAAQFMLGYHYDKRGMDMTNVLESVRWYRKSAEQGYLAACLHLADIYKEGRGKMIKPNLTEADKWSHKVTDSKNAIALFDLGSVYYKSGTSGSGDNLIQYMSGTQEDNMLDAARCYLKAANLGDAVAQFNMGVLYKEGKGVVRNMAQAVEWYQEAANQGYALAQFHLGYCYANGEGIDRDPVKAVEWYRKAANQGDAIAQFHLGYCYDKGEGIARDLVKAVVWYRRAAKQEDVVAQSALASCYAFGSGVEEDKVKAVKWYQRAAGKGHGPAQYSLSCHYLSGSGIDKDTAKSAYWCLQAAKQGVADAQFLMGCMYEAGEGFELDPTEAVKWYLKAAMQGFLQAQLRLGHCYRTGTGVEKNEAKAEEWCQRAAGGDTVASHHLSSEEKSEEVKARFSAISPASSSLASLLSVTPSATFSTGASQAVRDDGKSARATASLPKLH